MSKPVSRFSLIVLAVMALALDAGAQNPNEQKPTGAAGQTLPNENQQIRPTYILGPNDQIMVRAQDVEDLNEKVFRVEQDGTIVFPPPAGQIKVQGMTVQELESELVKRLLVTIRNPQITILLIQIGRAHV